MKIKLKYHIRLVSHVESMDIIPSPLVSVDRPLAYCSLYCILICRAMHGLGARPVRVRYIVNKMALGQVFLRVLRVSPVNIILSGLNTHI
jgi:hypothetical protein